MAYGTKYKLQYYDRFDNLVAIYVQEDGYAGAETEVNGSGDPIKIHNIGEGEDIYKAIKGSTCEFNVISETDQQFLSIFTGTAKKYKIIVEKDGSTFWTGYVDPDSYREPFLHTPYKSTIHANDGLGGLKDIPFPKPNSTDLYNIHLPFIHYIYRALGETGLDLQIYSAIDLSFSGATRILEDAYMNSCSFRDDDNDWMSCYDVLEILLSSMQCRLFQKSGRWYIERIGYLRGNISYTIYNSSGVYQTTSTAIDPSITMTGVDGDPMCVWANRSPEMEIVPGLREIELTQDPGKRENILTFTDALGEFSDDEFQHPAAGAGPLEFRYWDWVNNYNGWQSYIYGYSKFPGTDYVRLTGPALAKPFVPWNVNLPSGPILTTDRPENPPYIESDQVVLDYHSMRDNGDSIMFNIEFDVAATVTGLHGVEYLPYLRWNMELTLSDSAIENPGNGGYYIKNSPGDTLTLYCREYDGKIYFTTVEEYVQSSNTLTDYNTPGIQMFRFKNMSGGRNEFSVTTEPLYFEQGYSGQLSLRLRIYPTGTVMLDESTFWNIPPQGSNDFILDVYNARVRIIDDSFEYSEVGTISIDEDNRQTRSYTIKLNDGTSEHNQQYFNKYIPLKSDGSKIGNIWTSGGVAIGSITSAMTYELMSQFNRPTRKLTGTLVSDPEDFDFGKVLVDNYGKKYLCTGVEYDAKQCFWNGEWVQLYDPATADAGDYDADDFGTGDFWAI